MIPEATAVALKLFAEGILFALSVVLNQAKNN